MSWEMLPGGSHLPKTYLVTMCRSVSYLSTINMSISIFSFLEYFQYFIYIHSRYTHHSIQYLMIHLLFSMFFDPHPAHIMFKHKESDCLHWSLNWKPAGWDRLQTSLSSIQLKSRLHWQSQTLSKAAQRWKEKKEVNTSRHTWTNSVSAIPFIVNIF